MKKPLIPPLICAALVASALIPALPAAAATPDSGSWVTPGTPSVLASDLVSPLSLEVGNRGVTWVSQNFAGLLTRVDRAGTPTIAVSSPGNEIGALSSRRGVVYYAENAQDLSTTSIRALAADGTSSLLADLRAYEVSANPDQVNTYGFVDLPQSCIDQVPADAMAPAVYTGLIDSHPYATFANGSGVYVADAGMNALLRVSYSGKVSTVAVLPPNDPVVVTAALAAEAGFPSCVVGYGYRFEPVPTDVEYGPDGWLYVTSLPGGPEDPSAGPRGAVYKVHPWTGEVKLVASGFTGATGLAISRTDGTIYVSELFGGPTGTGRVSVVTPGSSTPEPFITLNAPAAIELRHNRLYVTTNAIGPDDAPPSGTVTVVPLTSGSGLEQDALGGS